MVHDADMFSRVVVGVDGSLSSRTALRWAVGEARLHRANVVAVMAWHYPAVAYIPVFISGVAPADAMQTAAETALAAVVTEELGDDLDVTVEQVAMWATPREALIHHVEKGTLLVLGHHDRDVLGDILLGSVVQHVSHRAVCPVAVIPAGWGAAEGTNASNRPGNG
jgi:nucleotide-binding universal stress UspA family protein